MMHADRTLPDGRILTVEPLTYGRGRIGIGNGYTYDDVW